MPRVHLPSRNWKDEIDDRWAWCGLSPRCSARITHDPSAATCARCLLKLYADMGLVGPDKQLDYTARNVARMRARTRIAKAHPDEFEQYFQEEVLRVIEERRRQVEMVA